MTEIMARAHGFGGEGIKKFRVRSRVGGTEIIDGIDEAAAEEMEPDAVDLDPGELGMTGEPVAEGVEFVAGGIGTGIERGGFPKQPWPCGLTGAWVGDFPVGRDEHDLFAAELVGIVIVAPIVAEDLGLDPGEHGGPIVVIVLGPAVERVVVALGAIEAGAEEDLGDGEGAVDGSAVGAMKVGGWMAVGAAAGGDQFAGHDIEGFVAFDAVADPAVEDDHALAVEGAFLDAQEVGPFQRPEIGELGTFKGGVDGARPFVRGRIVDEGAGFECGGWETQQIEVQTTEEEGIGDVACRQLLSGAEFREDVVVDEVGRAGTAPVEPGSVGNEGEPDGFLVIEVTDEHDGFAVLQSFDRAIGQGADIGGDRFIDGFAADIAPGAVREVGDGLDEGVGVGRGDDEFGGGDFESGENGSVGGVVDGAVGDPLGEAGVFPGSWIETASAFMGEGGDGLEEEKAVGGDEGIDAASAPFLGQGAVIGGGIFAAKGEFEAALAVGVAVAGPGIATGPGQDLTDIPPIRHVAGVGFGFGGCAPDEQREDQQDRPSGGSCRATEQHGEGHGKGCTRRWRMAQGESGMGNRPGKEIRPGQRRVFHFRRDHAIHTPTCRSTDSQKTVWKTGLRVLW